MYYNKGNLLNFNLAKLSTASLRSSAWLIAFNG